MDKTKLTPFDGQLDKPAAQTETLKPFEGTLDGEEPKRGFGGWARDIGATAVKGAIAVPEMVVGLADIPTGGRVGKFLENEGGAVGFRPKQAKEIVNEWHSDATKEAQRKFQEADGFWDKAATAVQNPSLIATAVGESIPSMLAGGVMGRGALAASRGLGFAATPAATAAGAALATKQATIAGAAGEGLSMAGSAAEQIRQETEDGLLTPMQSGAALLTGAVGGAISRLSGGLQNKLGIGDADTMAVQGLGRAASPGAAAVNPLVQQTAARSIPNQVVLGAINEGLLEELPQSLAEQMLQNVALGKPWHQDLDAAAIMGTLSGGVMGAGAAGFNAYRNSGAPEPVDPGSLSPKNVAEYGNLIDTGIKPELQQQYRELLATAQDESLHPRARADAAQALHSTFAPEGLPKKPATEALRAEYEARLADLQAQEQGEAPVRQTTPESVRKVIEDRRAAEMAAGRAVAGPDDEIYQSTGATDPVRQMVQQAADAGGALSSAAVVAIDTGAAGQMQQAADQAQAQAVAQEQAKAGKKADPAAKVDASTGEIAGGAMASWSDDQLSSAFRGAQDRKVRIQIANELQRRRTEREQADLQAELQAEQAAMGMPDLPDNAFASVSEDAGEAPADLFIDEPATRSPATRKGNSNGPQATQAQQAEPKQPAQPANSTATGPAFAGSDRQGEAVGQPVPQPGALTNAAPTANNGAQAAPAPGPQTQTGGEAAAPAVAATEALRAQLREVEDKILRAAPGAMAAGGGDIEAAMKSPKVPVTLKVQRKKLKDQMQAAQPAGESGDGIKLTPAQKREIEAGGTGFVGELGESARSSLQAMRNNPKVPVIPTNANGGYFNDELPQYTDIGSGFSVRGYSVRGDVVQDIKLPNGMVIQRKLKADGSVTGSAEGNYDQIVEGKGFAEAEKMVADYFAGPRPEAQTRALPAPKVEAADAPKSGYTLPDGDINHEWRDAKGRETQHPDFEPTARQQILMDAVGKVLDAGAFYSDDVTAKVAEMLGVSKDVLASNRTGVQGGDFGYDVYLASRALETKRATKNSEKIARELNLSVGDSIGTLMFLDFKVTTGVTITSKNDTGLIYRITGKRGAAVLNAEVGVDNLKGAIERAHERGKRKDSYADFIASRKAQEAAAQPAPKKSSRSVLAKLKEQARAEHFAPGNVIASYGGGHDRVVSYQPSDEQGNWSVTVRAVQKQGDTWVDVPNERDRTHSTQPDAKELTRGPVGKVEANADAQEGANVDDQAQRFAGNKLFTADKVAAARARMKKKLGTLNSGMDPEMLIDGMTVAGAYIEAGVRNFTQYAKAMIDDMGDGVKPYLLSFWEGARNFPGLDATGMTVSEESKRLHEAMQADGATKADSPSEVDHNGTRIYQSRIKFGDAEPKLMWAVESATNKAKRMAGERTVSGDTLHDSLDQAKAAADREAQRDAADSASKAELEAQDKARQAAEEARKAENRGKSVVERRKDAILDGPSKIGQGTKRAVITSAVDNGYAIEAKMVYDYAARKRDQETVDRASRAGYILGVSNENLPLVKAGNEAKARLKEGKYEKPEYRVYQGSDTNAPFREITKTEYDYAQELKAQRAAAQQAEAVPAASSQQATDDFLPEGWTKSINGYTKRPVYRMEQGGGQPFAVVTQVEGMQYEMQIRHGDKQLTVSNQTGALSEVLAKAEAELTRMTQADSVTHQDPGEKPEAATKAVVSESLKTAARNEDAKPSEMRKWLLAEIEKEMLAAPDRADYDETVKRVGEKDAISMYTGGGLLGKNTETGFITFDVPGDGKFKVRNSMRGLLEFRKNVNASGGFKDSGQKTVRPPENKGALDGGSKMDAITNMIEEGDFEAARDYAEAVGIKLDDVKVPKGDRKPQWDAFRKNGTLPPEPVSPSKEWKFLDLGGSFANESEAKQAVLTRTADGSEYVATVKGRLDGTSAKYAITKDGKQHSAMTTRMQFSEALVMAEAAMPKANDKPAPSKAKDTGWGMAGTGNAGKRYIGRNITLEDGREVVARVYENAGTYEEAEVKVDGVRKFAVTDRYDAQGKADAFIKTLTGTSAEGSTSEMTPEEAAKYLKDFVYSLDQLDGMTDRAQVLLSSPLGKSGRDNLLMESFGLTRDQAHDINNRLDARQPKKLRSVDMHDAFKVFPSLRKMVDDAIQKTQAKADSTDAPAPAGRTYLLVPFEEKDLAKVRGAKWDAEKKVWYADPISGGMAEGEINVNLTRFIPEDRTADDRFNYYGDKGIANVVALNAQQRDGVPRKLVKRKHPDEQTMFWSVVPDDQKAEPSIPEGYKPAGEPFYREGKQVQGYAPFNVGDRVTVKDSGGQSGVIDSLASPDESGVFASAVVKFDNGSSQMVQFGKLEADAKRFDVPNPPTWDYRLKQRGGSTYLIPPVGQSFDQETRRELRDWARNAGFSASIITDNEISVAAVTGGPSLDYIVDGVKEQAYGRQADKERAAIQSATANRRDPTKVSAFTPYQDGDIVSIGGQDWTIRQDMPGWYLTNTGDWKGKHPTIRDIKAMNDLIAQVEQAATAQPETQAEQENESPKLTTAEAKALMEWQDMGQRAGVKTHALHFYESQANKDANRGRMTLVNVTKGDKSASNWFVDGDDKPFAVLGMAKKRAEELGMLRAISDGFVEGPFAKYEAEAGAYGYKISADGKITKDGKTLSPVLKEAGGRLRIESPDGNLLFSGAQTGEAFGRFVSKFWGATRESVPDVADQNDRDTFTLQRLNKEAGKMEPVAFKRGETVKLAIGQKPYKAGVITGISHAERKFKVDGNDFGHDFGYAYKADFDEMAAPKAEVDADLDKLEQRLNDENSLQWEGFISSAKSTIERENLGDYAKARIADLSKRAAELSNSVLDKMRAAKAEKEAQDAKARAEKVANEKPLPDIDMTMEEWKATSKDYKSIMDGQRMVLREGGMRKVNIVKPAATVESKTPTVDSHMHLMQSVRDGTATPEQFKASFNAVVDGKQAILAELDTKTKVELLRTGGAWLQTRYASEKKSEVAEAFYRQLVGEYTLGEGVNYGMGKGAYEAAVRRMVEATDEAKLKSYLEERKAAVAEAMARRAARVAAITNPQTLADFREVIGAKISDGMSQQEAFLTLTPEQRIKYDTLAAESTRERREEIKRKAKTQLATAGNTSASEVIATKHTKLGHDLFVVKLADRVERDEYLTLNNSAKRLGGSYSSFRGNGAIPGFQFRNREAAEAFRKLVDGDTTQAQELAAQRRDAFEDDRSQTAVERLRAMAEKLEAQAEEEENRERKTNTAKRARYASSALAGAAADKAKAKTMRNIADAIEAGNAKFLDEVRTKTQVDMLTAIVATAKSNELRAKHPSYADQEKRRGEPPTAETADFAEFPSYASFRSDLASLARQMLEVEGTKKLGQRLMSVADDVTDTYLEFAKKNISKVSQFGRGDAMADFANKDDAERAIRRSGLTGKAIVLAVKRGQNRVILSPGEAIGRKIWEGDGDKRITLNGEFGAELVEAIGRRGNKQNSLTVPWQFQNAYDRRKALSRLGIETASEYRSAVREFIALKEQAVVNRTKELELQMVGRKADGLDFFPTPAEVADQMIEAADLSPDMAVLEPSAGMGHLADRIREAGAEPDVIEASEERRELLLEKGYHMQG